MGAVILISEEKGKEKRTGIQGQILMMDSVEDVKYNRIIKRNRNRNDIYILKLILHFTMLRYSRCS